MDYSPRYGRFRALLRQIRWEAGFSQATLSAKLRKTQTFVSRSELGERRIDFMETLDFFSARGVPVAELVKRLEDALEAPEEILRLRRQSPGRMDRLGRVTP